MKTAHIENWFKFGDGIAGQISKHDRQEDFVKLLQWTSKIIELNEEEGWCQTENTMYTLGKKAGTADPYIST